MKNAMNILYLCDSDPDSHATGARVRTHLLYEALCRIGRTYVLCGDKELRVVPGERMFRMRGGLGPIRRFINWVFWVSNSYLFGGCPKLMPVRYRLNVKEAFPGVTFDCVVVRYPHEGGVSDPWRYGRLFIDFDDHPQEIYETMFATRHSVLRRWVSRKVIRWTIGRIVRRCAGVWVSNPERVKDFPVGTCVHALENVPTEVLSEYEPSVSRDSSLLIVGYMAWEPNRDGVETFLADIWPAVRAEHPELSLRIAGGGLPDEVRERWEKIPGVKCVGFVADLREEYAHTLATVVPIDGGSGTCIKTRDALSHSRVCLSTPFGARGIAEDDLRDGNSGILVYRTANEFLSYLKRVLAVDERAGLERRAYAYAQKNLTFEHFVSQVKQLVDVENVV